MCFSDSKQVRTKYRRRVNYILIRAVSEITGYPGAKLNPESPPDLEAKCMVGTRVQAVALRAPHNNLLLSII